MRRRNLILILVLIGGCAAARWIPTNRVTIVNESGRTARDVRVGLSEVTFDCGTIPPGGRATVRYVTPRQDDYVRLRCLLDGGITIEEDCIYLAWENYFGEDTIVIQEDGSTKNLYGITPN